MNREAQRLPALACLCNLILIKLVQVCVRHQAKFQQHVLTTRGLQVTVKELCWYNRLGRKPAEAQPSLHEKLCIHGHPGTHAYCYPGARAAYGGHAPMHQKLMHDSQIHTIAMSGRPGCHELQVVQVGQQTLVVLMAGCIH